MDGAGLQRQINRNIDIIWKYIVPCRNICVQLRSSIAYNGAKSVKKHVFPTYTPCQKHRVNGQICKWTLVARFINQHDSDRTILIQTR